MNSNLRKFKKGFFLLLLSFSAIFINAQVITVSGDVTTNTTWTNNNIYLLSGDIIVRNNATLTIEPGTIIKGDKPTIGRLIVSRSGMINANGTAERPIVFTSNQPVGAKAPGDWGGIAIIGEAPSNAVDGIGNPIDLRLECGTTTDYDGGGSNPSDNSGIFRYVRIEYAGVACALNKELNGLTMLCVGSGTTIDHIQVSYGGDDAFEWFGGSVNCNYLIAMDNTDDDFDADNGFVGKVQFGLVVRSGAIADAAGDSNFFEVDNDATGTSATPFTAATFSNITCVGPYETPNTVVAADAYYGRAARLRRNNKIKIFNSIFLGHKRGLFIEGGTTQTNATNGDLVFRNNIIAGSKLTNCQASFDSTYCLNPSNNITLLAANTDVMLTAPYGTNRNFLPMSGSPALSGSAYSHPSLNGFQQVSFRGGFGNDDWTSCWAEWTPGDEAYSTPSTFYGITATATAASSTTICPGASLTLNASSSDPAATYTWSNGTTGSSTSINAPGNYFVTARSSRGCQAVSAPVTVIFHNVITPTISGNSNFCPGASTTLTASNGSSYSWSNGSTNATSTINAQGSYSVTVTDANGCTASSSPFSVSPFNVATPIITADGPTSFCTGDSVTLTSSAASSYAWSNNSTSSSVVVLTGGSYSVTTTDANGCTASSAPQQVSVSNSPSPTINVSGPISFCQGGQVVLTSSQGDSFIWSNGSTSQSITVTQSGSYVVTVTNANACLGTGASSATVVTVNAVPTTSFSYVSNNGEVTFTNNTSGATIYNWNFGDGSATASDVSPVHEYAASGVYNVTLIATSQAGCSYDTTQVLNIVIIGIEQEVEATPTVLFYPNPVQDMAILKIESIESVEMSLSITDLNGRVVFNQNIETMGGTDEIRIETSNWTSGIYMVNVKTAEYQKSVRILKK